MLLLAFLLGFFLGACSAIVFGVLLFLAAR